MAEQGDKIFLQMGKFHYSTYFTEGIKRSCENSTRLFADYSDIYKLTGQDEVPKAYSFPKLYASYRKTRADSIKQKERVRQMMIEWDKAKEA